MSESPFPPAELFQQRQEAEYSYIAAKLNLANILQATISSEFEVSDQAAYGSGQVVDREATVQGALTSRPDYRAAEAAVQAAMEYEWSSGQVEGQINRLKMVKRQMFGRANLDLLKARVLKAA